MNHTAYVAYEVTAQRLAFSGGQILPLKPVLIALLLAKPNLQLRKSKSVYFSSHKHIVVSAFVCITREVMNSSLVSMSGVSRQARNLREVLEVRSCTIPAAGRDKTDQYFTVHTIYVQNWKIPSHTPVNCGLRVWGLCSRSLHSNSNSGIRATFCKSLIISLPMIKHSMNCYNTDT